MASTFKTFLNNDKTTTRTLLHEAIPITGTIFSGTYGLGAFPEGVESNIKNYSHGMFQSVYDYPYLSSSANHILDLTIGYSSASHVSASVQNPIQRKNKINMYNQMAQVLMGHDKDGNIQRFDIDGNLADGSGKMDEVIFVNFARLLNKDEIKKGSFYLDLGLASVFSGSDVSMAAQARLNDVSGTDGYFVNSPAGEYGVLNISNLVGTPIDTTVWTTQAAGLLFYQAGIAVLTASIFQSSSVSPLGISGSALEPQHPQIAMLPDLLPLGTGDMECMLSQSYISSSCDALRHRIVNLSFNNTTELNSTIYFCRMNNNESEPLRKDPSNELTVRVRLDY